MKRNKFFSFIPHPSVFIPALRGRVTPRSAALEAVRRARAALAQRGERRMLTHAKGEDDGAARLTPEFARLGAPELLEHFRTRERPKFLHGFADEGDKGASPSAPPARFAEKFKADRRAALVGEAEEIVSAGRWPLLGYGVLAFSGAPDWTRDPVSGARWPLRYHADLRLVRDEAEGGGDVRVVWELNRLGHLLTLGRAYRATRDERFAEELLRQAAHWRAHNPVGFGPNWACAMEAALRASNLLAAFQLILRSPRLDETRLALLLSMFDEHGAHILRNLEYSYIATSNHYLSDVTGLFWLGVCLPELEAARGWRQFGLRELLREMDKQVLKDGADCEASTGYQRFVAELFLYSFILARANGIEIERRNWQHLRAMLGYVRSYLRPDGRAPLVGDTDGGQFLPFTKRDADDHAYLLAVGAAVFKEPRFRPAGETPEEVFWTMGAQGVIEYEALDADSRAPGSQAFAEAGIYVMREGDLYLLFNASGAGLEGRGSHGHNDALSIEVSARGACFIRDPGTYVYTADPGERHLFRSTAYHSTVEVDGAEQNTTNLRLPFRIGDEAHPRVLRWESDTARDLVVAEHDGYASLKTGRIRHRRAVLFDKREGCWLVEDTLSGAGLHTFRFIFHLAPGLRAQLKSDAVVEVCDRISAARLLIVRLEGGGADATIEPRRSSRDYGSKEDSQAACWIVRAHAPVVARWALVPIGADESEEERIKLSGHLKEKFGTVSLTDSF
ncbi:MAG: heparinase II/III family protein [Acidobacteria bacterium]|nr:heparinase II/III family protein [Acidobacteriota bacterium]